MVSQTTLRESRVLVTNDDGINSPGIGLLEEIAHNIFSDVWVVAPNSDQSGTSHSLTLRRPLRITEFNKKKFAVNGTPSDCVLLSVNHIMKDYKPDIVLSGINHGKNIGDDVMYSGTIAAAMEAALLGLRAIALSQDMSDKDRKERLRHAGIKFSSAMSYAENVMTKVLALELPDNILLNINFPAVLARDVVGVEVTRQGPNKIGDEIIEILDPREHPHYWIGKGYKTKKAPPETDRNAIENNYISITPISTDLTHEKTVSHLKGIIGENLLV